MIRKWIEAMRLRTLPVSIAGVLAGCGCAVWQGGFSFLSLRVRFDALIFNLSSNKVKKSIV